MKDVICFEVNDWFEYPKFFEEWFDYSENDKHPGKNYMKDLDAYAKENKLCIKVKVIDMSVSLIITAPKEWVEKNIPEFFEKKWQDKCVSLYPAPFYNEHTENEDITIKKYQEEYTKERKALLAQLHAQFSDEEIDNFKPHNILSGSGETFFDWIENNYGAVEVLD